MTEFFVISNAGNPNSALAENFPETIDVPRVLSFHDFDGKFLIIAPEKAAWIVTDELGSEIVRQLSTGKSIGETASVISHKAGISPEDALNRIRGLVEIVNRQRFRESFETVLVDIDKRPRNLQLFLTKRCNLNCRHCYYSAGEALQNELSTKELKDIIRSFAGIGAGNVVTLTGGEPMMRKDFFEIVEEAVYRGLKVYLLSNGGLIRNAETARKIAGLIDNVQISLDGTCPEINDSIRGKGSFDHAVRAISLLLAEKVDVEMTTVVLPENVEDLEKNLVAFVESLGKGRLKCSLTVANPKGRLEGALSSAGSLVGRVLHSAGPRSWLRHGAFQPGRLNFGCELSSSIVVSPDGKIGNCPYLNYSGPRSALNDDLGLQSHEDNAWHRKSIIDSKKCLQCDLRNFQCGGCKIFGECGEQIKARNYFRMLEGL